MATGTAFFYGTLMAPGVLYRVCFGTARPEEHRTALLSIRPALLQGYRRQRVRQADYPGITAVAGASVLGTYVTGLTPQDLARLDTFEGNQYDRVKVTAQLLKGSVDDVHDGNVPQELEKDVETEVYVFRSASGLEDKEWDFSEFKRDKLKMWAWDDLSDYEDLTYEDQEEDGTGGRGFGGDITAQLETQAKQEGLDAGKGAEAARSAV